LATADLIYDAALHPEEWQIALLAIAKDLGARDVAIGTFNSETMIDETINSPIDPYFIDQYESYWSKHNFLWERTAGLQIGQIFSFDSVMPREEFIRTRFYNEWWCPQGLDRVMGMNLASKGHASAVITVYRPKSRPDFTIRERRKFSSLLPHLIRALEIRECLAHTKSVEADFRETLACIDRAGFVVDGSGQLIFCNRMGERLLSQKSLSLSGGGSLIADSASDTAALRRLITNAFGSARRSGRMLLAQADQRAMMARVYQLPGYRSAFSEPRVLILFDDPNLLPACSRSDKLLRLEYNLTAAEAVVAMQLSSGETLKRLADRTGISYATVRTHLARVFDKMGVHSQSELSRLIIKSGFDLGNET
jgi:DNA-binding CsgD family transcriptional regulator/PAS domain-containing protein